MDPDFNDLKIKVYQHCLQKIEAQIKVLKDEVEHTKDALEAETKSTVGDKHETGRAMVQQEQEQLYAQLYEAEKTRDALLRLPYHKTYDVVQAGALVETEQGFFFLAAGIGKEEIERRQVFVLATSAPLARQMVGKKAGDSFLLNQQHVIIKSIC